MMSVNDLKHHVELWEILDEIKLTYLAIELCALLPHRAGQQGVEKIINLHQKCSSLKALETSRFMEYNCKECIFINRHKEREFLLLSNFYLLFTSLPIIANIPLR